MYVLDDGLVFAGLRLPDAVEVLQSQRLLFDHEAQDLLQLLHVLRLMQAVPQHDRQHVILLDPFLGGENMNTITYI